MALKNDEGVPGRLTTTPLLDRRLRLSAANNSVVDGTPFVTSPRILGSTTADAVIRIVPGTPGPLDDRLLRLLGVAGADSEDGISFKISPSILGSTGVLAPDEDEIMGVRGVNHPGVPEGGAAPNDRRLPFLEVVTGAASCE